jgi:hypothetical protein
MIIPIKNDLFIGIKDNPHVIIIPHICNDLGLWGKGFVIPLGQHFPKAKQDYQDYVDCQNKPAISNDLMGDTVFTKIPPRVIVANMIAQKGIGSDKPIRYAALAKCMETVNKTAKMLKDKNINIEIHCPRFGSGLAGGNWVVIEEFINEIWRDWKTYVYSIE